MNKTPKKIYYVWNYLEWGGAQVYFFGLMKEAKKYCEVVAVLPKESNEQLLKFLDNLPVPYELLKLSADNKTADTLKRKLQRHWNKIRSEVSMLKFLNKFDLSDSLLHIELAPWQSMLALCWLCCKAKVFITLHNSVLPIPKSRRLLWQIKFAVLTRFKNFHIFTSNKDAKESLKTLVPREFFEKIKVTYTNVNPSEINEALNLKIQRDEILEKYNLPANKFLVFCVGQFIDRKGRWVFLDAAGKLLKTNDDIAFVWIYNSKISAEDLVCVGNYSLGKNFFLITSEQVGREHIDLFKLLRVADVFALASYLEGLPISLLEAMALGIPSVSTDITAVPEAVKPFETGLLVESGNSEALKNAIQKLKDDLPLRQKLSKNGREFVLANFSEPVVAKIAVDAYFESFQGK